MTRRGLLAALVGATTAGLTTPRRNTVTFLAKELVSLLMPPPSGNDLSFGQGVILEFDLLTASNKVSYRGAVLADLPLLNTTDAILLEPGSVVGVLSWRNSYFILGRITVPNSASAGTALDAIRMESVDVNQTDPALTSTGGAFLPLPTIGPVIPDLLVSKSGRVRVDISAELHVFTSGGTSTDVRLGVDITGATTRPVQVLETLKLGSTTGAPIATANTRTVLIDDLNPGLHTFEVMYLVNGSGEADVGGRNLTVTPF